MPFNYVGVQWTLVDLVCCTAVHCRLPIRFIPVLSPVHARRQPRKSTLIALWRSRGIALSPLCRYAVVAAAAAAIAVADCNSDALIAVIDDMMMGIGTFLLDIFPRTYSLPDSLLDNFHSLFIARQHTDARYWYSNSVCTSVCLSVCLSVTFRYQMKTA